MNKVTISKGKWAGLQRCAGADGIIAAAAMDQRGSLQKALSKARDGAPVSKEEMVQFKTAVSQVLTRHASAILLDPEYGLPAAAVHCSASGRFR